MFPRVSQISSTVLLVAQSNKDSGLQRELPTTGQQKNNLQTAVMVDSQMANCNKFGYQQAIPHSPFIASTSGVLVLQARKIKRSLQWPGLTIPSQYKSVKTDASMAWIKKNQSSLHKRHTGQELLSCCQPFRDYSNMKLLVFKSKVKMTVQTLLPYGRKKGLFGHIVAKSRKA